MVAEITAAGGEGAAVACDLGDRAQTVALIERAAAAFGPDRHPRQQRRDRQQLRPAPAGRVQGRVLGPDARAEPDGAVPALEGGVAAHAGAADGDGSSPSRRSTAAFPSPHSGAYVASKHGVIGLMRTLALEVAAEGITVNCVCPGPVHTRVNDARIAYDAQRLGREVGGVRARADADRRPARAGGHRADGRLPGG